MAKKMSQVPTGASNITLRGPGVGGGFVTPPSNTKAAHKIKGPAAGLNVSNTKVGK